MTLTLGLGLLLTVSVLTAIGQICFKKVAVLEHKLLRKFLDPLFLVGAFLFVCCPVMSSLAAQAVDFSVMYAMTALNYVFVLLLSWTALKEKIDRPKVIGVVVIIVGVWVMVLP